MCSSSYPLRELRLAPGNVLCRAGCRWRNLWVSGVCHVFKQRRQPPRGAGTRAALQVGWIEMQHAVRPVDAELAAGGWTPVVDTAAHLLADLPLQRYTARELPVGSLHAPPEVVQVFRQVDRNRARRRIIRFGPVKRHTKIGAARATS